MKFRTKLVITCMVATLAAAGVMTWGAARYARGQFETFERQQTDAVLAQFQREIAQRGDEVARAVQGIADAEATVRMALDLSRPQADFSLYADDARGLAATQHLDYLELLAGDGSLISSAQWPGRMGYRNEWIAQPGGPDTKAFLDRVELPDGTVLGVLAARAVTVGGSNLYIVGGRKLDREFLSRLALSPETKVLLYPASDPTFVSSALTSAEGSVAEAQSFASVIASALAKHSGNRETIRWDGDVAGTDVTTLPLGGRDGALLGLVLAESSGRGEAVLANIQIAGAAVAGAGLLFSLILGWWTSRRVGRPLARLEAAARAATAQEGAAEIPTRARDEAGRTIRAFNDFTKRLADQRRELVQTERVTAWREMSHRMAHEVKDQLFPLQVATENLRRSRELGRESFDQVFLESLATLAGRLEELKKSVARFGDFAKMPRPKLEPVDVNEVLRATLKPLEAEFSAIGRPTVAVETFLDGSIGRVTADRELLRQALESLFLRSRDAMPAGGTLTIRTRRTGALARVEAAHSGTIDASECARMFTGYHAASAHTAGLGLATAQLVVSELGGRISAESTAGMGTVFAIELPLLASETRTAPPAVPAKAKTPKPTRVKHQELRITDSEPAAPVSSPLSYR
jgi:signal transduction histidine kinase